MTEEMPFIGVYRSLYPYQPQQDPEFVVAENKELELEENELLYILEKGEDLWWRVKKKAPCDQEDGDIGLVPGNYLEECKPVYQVRTLYDYEQQSFEEISFNEGEILDVFDEDGENWVFARCGSSYGFAPSNYLEKITNTTLPSHKSTPIQENTESQLVSTSSSISPEFMKKSNVSKETFPSFQNTQLTNKLQKNVVSFSEKPVSNKELSNSETLDAYAISSEPYSFNTQDNSNESFKTWTVHEIDKKKRRKGALGVGSDKITFSCESGKKSPQVFPISSIIQYSVEKKHVFIDVSSSKSTISYDFHAGSSETAAEIYSAIENLASISRSTLKEIASAAGTAASTMHISSGTVKEIEKTSYKGDESTNNNDNNDNNDNNNINRFNFEQLEEKKGIILYDFDAVEDDELSVKENTEVFILDDTSNNDWWKVKKGDHEGLVPASYIRYFPQNLKVSRNQKNVKNSKDSKDQKKTECYQNELQKSEKKVHVEKKINKPQLDKIRTWTDRTGSFKVDAQFLGIIDNKIHLHKLNGIKISVPMSKMSLEDIHYVESITEPFKNKQNTTTNAEVSDTKQSKTKNKTSLNKRNSSTSISKNNYDWFDFFLSSGVKYELCQTYATNFENENLVESNLLDLTREDMQSLGIKDDDIIRITKNIREKFKNKLNIQEPKLEINKTESQITSETENLSKLEDNLDSLLSLPNEKSQSLQVNNKTDTHSFSKSINKEFLSETKKTSASGFEDDAWSIRSPNTKKNEPSIPNTETTNPQLAHAMKNLSLLTPPMKPTHTSPISSQFSKQQIQQNILPQAQPISQTTIQNQYTTVDPFSTTFTNMNPNPSHLQPYQNYGITNIPVASRYFSSPIIQPTIPQFQYHQTLQPQITFDQKTKQQIPHNSLYIDPQLSTNQTQLYNSLPFTQQNTTLPLHLQNNGHNNSIPQHTTIQQPFQNANIFRHSVASQYNNYNQSTNFLQNTYHPSIQQQQLLNNFISSDTLKHAPNNPSFSTTSQPPNTSFKQTPIFKPVQFGTSKLSRPESTERRANIAAATPENPFGF
ncbi:hypothetical protein PNEG_00079 [Pneumocystis murina B123]|uniref:Actin cytoskeleton-regulatory complex protein SLA1 n=1 Tax=Pneumocystis murina (strain B123) TaxID=1069680 RepID=M7PCK7_PNEMU|nr:hypothetical protein PNEG_00079 [Pneumocystis murina B123]EMR11640.1 hypothetical protein PNEG_00079 [Pneumocystis murina B123]